MRPSVRPFSAFRVLVCLTACLVLASLICLPQAAAQDTKQAPTQPGKKSEQGVVFKEMTFNTMAIGTNFYTIGSGARFYAPNGKPITAFHFKPGDIVDIEYLTGGARTEMWPHYPNERVLVTMRLVARAKK